MALGFMLVAIPRAHAHDTLLDTSPAHNEIMAEMPADIRLTFNNEIIALAGANIVEVRDAHGKVLVSAEPQVAKTTVVQQVQGLQSDSVYRVVWRVVSSDGHPIEGSFNFGVGKVTEHDLAALPLPANPAKNALALNGEAAAKQAALAAQSADTAAANSATAKADNSQTVIGTPQHTVAAADAPNALTVVAISATAVAVTAIVILAVALVSRKKQK